MSDFPDRHNLVARLDALARALATTTGPITIGDTTIPRSIINNLQDAAGLIAQHDQHCERRPVNTQTRTGGRWNYG